MAAVLTRANKVGNVVKKEFWPDEMWCRKEVTLTYANLSANAPGEVIFNAGNVAAKWVTMPAAVALTDGIAIIIDQEIADNIQKDIDGAATGDVTTVVMYRGPSVVRSGALTYADATDIVDIKAVLAASNIELVDMFSVATQS